MFKIFSEGRKYLRYFLSKTIHQKNVLTENNTLVSFSMTKKSQQFFASSLLLIAILFTTGCLFQNPDGGQRVGIGYNKGYAPEQPIAFSHELHVGKNKIQCQYCHNQVERSKSSNIPSLATCMNCHQQVAGRNDPDAIKKLRDAYSEGKTIEWVRVHMLPDHVQFNHQAHVTKGVSCQTCHGEIEKMAKVYQYTDLSMGWCVNCHRQPENKAPLNCTTCHH
ncbi:MAG: cytochrome c3 family protein [Pseudobdellovibrio sp.]